MTESSPKKWWRKKYTHENPLHDPLRQELGYKLDERYSGCLVIVLAIGGLVAAVGTFLIYWLTRNR